MSLRVDMTGNSTGFQQMLNTAKSQAKAFSNSVSHEIGSSWGGIGKSMAAGFAGMMTYQGITGIISKVTGKISELRELSDQLGTEDVEKIQKWGKAFERVGGSMSKMTTLAAQMQGIRSNAMGHDVAAIGLRQKLEDMDMTSEQINPETGLSSPDFMQKVFHFANQSDENRAKFQGVFGAKATRWAGSEKYLDEAHAPINQETFNSMKETEKRLHEFGEAVESATMHLLKYVTWSVGKDALAESMSGHAESDLTKKMAVVRDKVISGKASDFEKEWLERATRGKKFHNNMGWLERLLSPEVRLEKHPEEREKPAHSAGTKPSSTKPSVQAVDEDLKLQREAWEKQETEALIGLHSAQGANMTIGDRMKVLRGDIERQKNETKTILERIKSPTLGMSPEAFKKLTSVEKEESAHKLRMELYGSQSKEERLISGTKEKPINYSVDSMAKTGLYSASNVAFSPLLGVQQKQLSVQEKILAKLGTGWTTFDPYEQ